MTLNDYMIYGFLLLLAGSGLSLFYVWMRISPKPRKCKYSAATLRSSSRGKSTAGDAGGYEPTAAALTCGGSSDCGDGSGD